MSNRARRSGTGRNQRLQRPQPRQRAKERGALVCEDCRIVCHAGRWHGGTPPLAEMQAARCPACSRIQAGRPAGTLRLPRALFQANAQEVLDLVRNAEAEERPEHPLERLMNVVSDADGLTVTTTGIHLAGVIAGKLERRLHKRPRVHYRGSDGVSVVWEE
jgi:hypothetical protein